MDTSHLKLKRRVWFARLIVPPHLRTTVGRTELLRTLKTRDIQEANRRKHAVLAELQRVLTQSELTAVLPKESAEYILQIAKGQRRALQEGIIDERTAEAGLDVAVDDQLELLRRINGFNAETGEPNNLDESYERMHQLAQRVLGGDEVELLSESVKRYLTEVASRVRKQTLREKERHLDALRDWLKTDREVTSISKKIAGRYVTESLLTQGHAPKTVKDILSNLSAFWVWLEGRGLVDVNPWRGMSGTVKGSTRGTAPKRRPWTDDELLKLMRAISNNDPLLPLTAIATFTGMRREEVASLRTGDVENDALTVREGKTKAALRRVPIHSALRPLITQLVSKSRDGYLIPGLLTGGADAKRSHYLGKRFGSLIREIGFDDPALVFHTLRNAFLQRCEEGGVPESSAKLLVGHSRKKSLTYGDAGGGYSPGVQLETLRKEVAKVTFGQLDGYLTSISGNVQVTMKSTRRPSRTKRTKDKT
ncbi:MAG TPA: tyrosine-type recombinase/integrase [Steroidobacteraceae bacterium]|jgi:integrase